MRTIRSAVLWTLGFLHFLVVACILSILLGLVPHNKLYTIVRLLFSSQIRIMGLRFQVRGLDRFDHETPSIYLGNHESLFDVFAVPVGIPRRFLAVEAAFHFSIPIWRWMIRRWGCIPMHRHDHEKAKEDIERIAKALQNGTSIAMLPEGTRTVTGEMGPFKKGAFYLAKKTNAPIVPFALAGLYRFQNKNSWHLNPGRGIICFGPPISSSEYQDLSVDELSTLVAEKIVKLKTEAESILSSSVP